MGVGCWSAKGEGVGSWKVRKEEAMMVKGVLHFVLNSGIIPFVVDDNPTRCNRQSLSIGDLKPQLYSDMLPPPRSHLLQ